MPPGAHTLKIGDPAPAFSLPGTDGQTHRLADFKAAPVLMVIFLCNHCPTSHAAETRLLPLFAEFKPRGLAVVAINPNNPIGLGVDELGFSQYNDTLPDMKLYARDQGFTFPYLYDGDTQETAKAYGCACTPDVFIFDSERKLRYKGRLDNSTYAEASTVHQTDARNAVVALLSGQPVPLAVTRPFGCATKWRENQGDIAKTNEKWESTPVTLAPLDGAGLAALVRNPTSDLRLINVWATWCVPCVEEFPNLVTLTRQFQIRNFEVITVSVDQAQDERKALRFLQKQHAALPDRLVTVLAGQGRSTDNYRYTGPIDSLPQTLDPEFPGPIPYTLLVAPGGKIIYRHAGAFDLSEMRSKLVQLLGRYYIPSP